MHPESLPHFGIHLVAGDISLSWPQRMFPHRGRSRERKNFVPRVLRIEWRETVRLKYALQVIKDACKPLQVPKSSSHPVA